MRLPADAPLFSVSSDLIRAFDLDLLAAGLATLGKDAKGRPRILKRDDRGRTLDLHCLRHTFGTHLSKGGVAPRTAQAAMRHSTLDLTMNTYTDPRLLDVAGALDVLPSLPLDAGPHVQEQRATGTDGPSQLVPTLVPTPGNCSTPGAIAGKMAGAGASMGNAVSVADDVSSEPLTSGSEKRATRLERATFSLEG